MNELAEWYKKFQNLLSVLFSTELATLSSRNDAFREYLEFTSEELSYYKYDENYSDNLKFMKIENGKITEIVLNNLKISALPANIFKEIVDIKKITLRRLPINELPSNIFSELVNLEFLYMDFLNVEKLNERLFIDLIELRTLAIMNTPIFDIPDNIFSNNKKLESIRLSKTHIHSIPESILGLTKLNSLYVSSIFPDGDHEKVWTLEDL